MIFFIPTFTLYKCERPSRWEMIHKVWKVQSLCWVSFIPDLLLQLSGQAHVITKFLIHLLSLENFQQQQQKKTFFSPFFFFSFDTNAHSGATSTETAFSESVSGSHCSEHEAVDWHFRKWCEWLTAYRFWQHKIKDLPPCCYCLKVRL